MALTRTTRQALVDAFLELGLYDPEVGDLSSAQSSVGLSRAQMLIDTAQARRLLLYKVNRVESALVANQSPHTIGSTGADITSDRPDFPIGAQIQPVGQTSWFDIDIWSAERYNREQHPDLTSDFPAAIYLDRTMSNMNLYTWPVQTTACTLALFFPDPVEGFAALDTSYTFPPGYYELFYLELAKLLAAPFGRAFSPDHEARRMLLETRIQHINNPAHGVMAHPYSPAHSMLDSAFERTRFSGT